MRADLHLHSRYSDGWVWPHEVAKRAARAGLEIVALTDHDSMEGVPEFLEACRKQGLRGIAAAEVDCVAPELAFDGELLTYFPRGSPERMARFLRNRLVAEQASRLGLRCTWGSDCHGPGSPKDTIGTFWGDFGDFG